MTDERWQLAYAIYEAAAPLAEPERQEYVAGCRAGCGNRRQSAGDAG